MEFLTDTLSEPARPYGYGGRPLRDRIRGMVAAAHPEASDLSRCWIMARQIIRAKSARVQRSPLPDAAMNNRIIKLQFDPDECSGFPNLRLSWSCKPFDDMPFCTSLHRHNPRFADLAESLDATGRTHELLARRVKINVERHGMLYTPDVGARRVRRGRPA